MPPADDASRATGASRAHQLRVTRALPDAPRRVTATDCDALHLRDRPTRVGAAAAIAHLPITISSDTKAEA